MSVVLTKPSPKKKEPNATPHSQGSRQRSGKKNLSGVVNYYVHGAASQVAISDFTPHKLNRAIQEGLEIGELADLLATLNVPLEKLAPKLGISKATLHRRKASGRLDTAESDRVVRFARLMGKAVEVLESEENARKWLTAPQIGLGGAVPLDYAETEMGAREVEDLLGRIEYGVYS